MEEGTREMPVNNAKCSHYSFLSDTAVKEAMESNPFEKINCVVIKELERAIITAKFHPGQKLNISRIAETMNVSPTPVWEAIEYLRDIGLVTAEPIANSRRNAYRVFEISNNEVEDFFQARSALETKAAQICAEKNWNVDLELLGRYANTFEENLKGFASGADKPENSYIETAKLDREFHQLLVRSTKNRFLIESYEALERINHYLSIKTSYYVGLQLSSDDARALGYHHMSIYTAIKNGYADIARNQMCTHLEFCSNHYLRNRNLEP